jgi:hypothetical protein
MNLNNIVKISNNRFMTYGNYNLNYISYLWKLDENNSLKYISKKRYDYNLEYIFYLKEENIIIPNYGNEYLHFYKINEDNTINKIFNTNLNYPIKLFFKYDKILFVCTYYNITFIDINNKNFIKQIDYSGKISCMTKLSNGNILFGFKEKYGFDIIEYKFNRNNCDLSEINISSNIYNGYLSQMIETKNGNIITYEKYKNFILILNLNRKQKSDF